VRLQVRHAYGLTSLIPRDRKSLIASHFRLKTLGEFGHFLIEAFLARDERVKHAIKDRKKTSVTNFRLAFFRIRAEQRLELVTSLAQGNSRLSSLGSSRRMLPMSIAPR
jgi:hypothetical protein